MTSCSVLVIDSEVCLLVNHEGNTSKYGIAHYVDQPEREHLKFTVLHIMLVNEEGDILKYGIGNYAGQ